VGETGIFPAAYIHLKKATVTNRGPNETAVPLEDPIVTEVTSTLQEWALLWKQLYVKHKVDLFYKVRHVMLELIDLRRQLLSGHLTQDQSRDVKRHITVRLDWGNEHLGLDLVPRKDFEMVDEDQISVSDIYKMHLSSRHSVQQSTSQGDNNKQRHGEPCRVPVPHHLLVNLKSFSYNSIGEDTDIFFCLYDLREGKAISEKFMVRLNKNGGPKNPEKVDRLCALFTDLSNKDMKRDLYIISQVIRTGRMLLNDSKKGPPHVQYRRPYGCAVLAMSDVLQTISELKEEKDFVLKVYTCNNENEWYQVHDNIIRKSSTKYTAPSSNYGLIISLQLLRGDMELVRRENPLIFSKGVAITRKLGFPDVIMPGDIRNDLYLTLERGDFERGGKSVQKNIEVTMYVLYADGEILKDCISLGSGEPSFPEYRSFVLYHNNSPRWSEVVKLPIPIDRFRGSHLRFEFRHCSTKDKGEKKLFGFAFTPLMREDGTTLSDDSHELYVYKCDENTTFSNHALYLGLPCCKEDINSCPSIPSSLVFQRSSKETFWISTQLSSTKLTQNVDLLALLKWKAHPERVMDILGRLRHVSGEEIVKFLQDILDTLFSILDDNTEKYGPLVFQSLVFIINLLRDSKYYHFRPVMDTYIQKHFAGALAYKELIRCLKWYMDRSAEVVRQDHIQEAMRALEYLFKFIVQSRILYSRATCGMEEEQFRSSIQELFQSIRFVLSLDSRSSETLLFTQAALLNSFPAIFDELLQMFTVQEVAEFVRGTLGSMPSTVHIGQSMDVVKLQSIARTVDSRLFSFPESRRILLPVVLHHIHLHLRQQKELLICSGILGSIFSIIKNSSMDTSVQEEVEMMVESLLDVLLQTLLSIMSKSQSQEAVRGQRCPQCTAEITGEYVSCLLSLLRQMTDVHFQHLIENFQSKEELKEFLLKILCVFRNLMKLSIFPRDWNVMRLLTSYIILTTAQHLSPALHKNFTQTDFDFKVWNSYFSLAVLYINQPSLQLENLSPAKKKKVLDRYGDMRVIMTYQLFSMWQNLGENKIHFIPGMIGPFLGVTLVPQVELRNIMIPIFHDMMDWEQRKNGNFKQVEAELIDKLDSLVSEGKGDENYRELFGLLLLEKIEQETWRETGTSFVTSVTRLMERLLDYRDCMKGDETENKKIGCTVNLLNFYKSEINKEEMYIRYIHKLCDMHLQAENFTEAAFTLLLYWELLRWEERPLKEFLHYPAQSEWHRKESLCRKVIHYFNKGKCWEFGIPLCRELAFQYESQYDYQSLSWIRKMEAAYYDNIMEQQRLEPEFFRVGFYGRKFPFFLRVRTSSDLLLDAFACFTVSTVVMMFLHHSCHYSEPQGTVVH
uniref:Dedicator of cytokinesis 3 n=1 Tax=Oryzias melastigma TaxID=30732 RepID=A0A3B3BR28_ORYME